MVEHEAIAIKPGLLLEMRDFHLLANNHMYHTELPDNGFVILIKAFVYQRQNNNNYHCSKARNEINCLYIERKYI